MALKYFYLSLLLRIQQMKKQRETAWCPPHESFEGEFHESMDESMFLEVSRQLSEINNVEVCYNGTL